MNEAKREKKGENTEGKSVEWKRVRERERERERERAKNK